MKTFEVIEKDGSSSKVQAEMFKLREEKLAFFVNSTAVYQYNKNTVEKVIEEVPAGETPIITKIG